MLAYRSGWGSKEEAPQLLREASLVCRAGVLAARIAPLQGTRETAQGEDHRQHRDQDGMWSEDPSDFMIV